MRKISILEKMRAPSRNVFCEGLGCETLASARLLGSDDDDLLRSAHHLRGLRDRVLHLVRVGRDGLHREHLAVLGDLLREPVRDDFFRLRLPALGLQRVAEFGNRGSHFGGGELRKLLDEIGLAFVACPRKLVREQVVAGHEVQDVVHPVDVSRGDEATRGDAQHITEVKLFRLHGLFSSQGSDYRDSLATRVWTYNSITMTNIAYMGLKVKPNRKSPYFRAFSRFLFWIKKFSSPKIKIWFEPMFFSGFFCGFERCGSAAFPNFRGGIFPEKCVRTNSRILHHVGKVKEFWFASLRSATNLYSILGVKTNSRFRILGEENFLILNPKTI